MKCLEVVINVMRLCFVFATLWFLRTRPFVRAGSNAAMWYELSYLMLIVPLIFPHQQHYAFLFCMPAMAVVVHFLLNPDSKTNSPLKYRFCWWITGVLFIVFNASLLAGAFNAWFNHYKILTYGALALCVLLAAIPKPANEVVQKPQ